MISEKIPGAVFNRVKLEFLGAMARACFEGKAAPERPLSEHIIRRIQESGDGIKKVFDTEEFIRLLRDYETGLNGVPDEAGLLAEALNGLSDEKSAAAWFLDHPGPPADCDPGNPAAEPWLAWIRRIYDSRKGAPAPPEEPPSQTILGARIEDIMRNGAAPGAELRQPDRAEFHSFSSEPVETRHLARRIAAMLAGAKRAGNNEDGAVSPRDILILVPDSGDFARPLRRELDRNGVPHDMGRTVRLSETPLGVFAARLAATAEKDLACRGDVTALISSRFVSSKALFGGEKISVMGFLTALSDLKIVSGSWDGLERAAAAVIKYYEGLDESKDPGSPEARALEKLKTLQRPYERCIGVLGGIFKNWERKTSAKKHAGNLEGALQKLGVIRKLRARDEDGADREEIFDSGAALDAFFSVMPGLKRLPGDMTAAEFRAALLERMDSKILASPPRSAETVSVRTLRGLEKRRWKYIFACGMTESGLSAAPPPPPMPDKNVLAALGLETDGDRAARMSAALLRALSFAETRLIMSFSLRGADGGGALPCRELQRLEDALSTKDKNGNIETKFRRTPRSSLTEFWTAAHDGSEWLPDIPDRVITDGDAELCNLLRGMESAEPYYKNVREWRDPENWREDSPPGRGKVNFGETQARVLSPSKLDSFGGCPYRYFAENVLGLSGPEDADLSPDAASAGAAVHSAMERTMRALAGDSAAFTDPEKFDINSEKFAGLAEESLRDEFDKLIKRSAGLSESAAKALAEKWAVKLRSFSTELFRMKLDRVLCRGKSALESIRQRTGPEDALRRRKGGPTKKERALDLMKKVEKGYIPSESEYEDLDLKGPFAALAAYLEKWRRNFRPALFEWRFGGGKEPFELDAGGEKIKVSGVIDRIDRGEENGRIALRVADYKSGKDQDFKKKTESGAKLQVPLYALIIDEALKREETAPGALRDFRGGRLAEAALFSLRDDKPFAGMDCGKDNMALFRKWLRLAARHIREGRLGPAPKDNCPLLNHIGYCKLGALCMADTAPVRRFEYSDLRPPDGGITAETGGMEDGQNE